MANEKINYSKHFKIYSYHCPALVLYIGKIAALKFKMIFHDVLNVIIFLIAIILLNI